MCPIANIYPDKNLVSWNVYVLKITIPGDRSFCYAFSPPTPATSGLTEPQKRRIDYGIPPHSALYVKESCYRSTVLISAFVATLHIRGRSRVKTRSKKVKEVAAGSTPHKISTKIVETITS
jgi:hypothetical protein